MDAHHQARARPELVLRPLFVWQVCKTYEVTNRAVSVAAGRPTPSEVSRGSWYSIRRISSLTLAWALSSLPFLPPTSGASSGHRSELHC